MVNKRKRDELADSDSDEVTPGKQMLPVADLPYDFAQEPQDGMQYLFLVRRDARRLPHVTRVPNPYEMSETEVTRTFAPPTNVLPCEEWRAAFQTHFYNLRKNLTQATINVDGGHSDIKRRTIPEKKDRDAWWKYLAGHPESVWNPKDQPAQKKITADMSRHTQALGYPTALVVVPPNSSGRLGDEFSRLPIVCSVDLLGNVASQPGFFELPQGVCPTPSTALECSVSSSSEVGEDCIEQLLPPRVTPSHLREIDHRMSIHLLMYFTHWINVHLQNPGDLVTTISVSHGQWIFALLTKIEEQLSADEMNLIRNLARACLGLIQKCSGEYNAASECVSGSMSVERMTHISDASCWIIFATIAGYWGQRDLWADAEAILASA